MKISILTLLFLISFSLSATDVTAYRNEPDGFNRVGWGAPVGTLFSKDDFVGFSSDEKSLKYQKISDDTPLELDNVKLYGMVYSYYYGLFWKVAFEARLLQAGKLLDLFIGKYGEPTRITTVSEFTKEYLWSGTFSDIIVSTSLNFYDKKTIDIATASIFSKKIKSEIEADIEHPQAEKKLPMDSVDGFRDRKWGSGFAKGVTYLPLEQEPFYEYLIKGDDMEFEGVNAREIRYRFYNNQALQKVELHFSGKQNYLKLKEACFRLFGNTSHYEHGEIRWIGKKTTARLSFSIDAGGVWTSRLNFFGFGTQ
jgi:hypothetical protein